MAGIIDGGEYTEGEELQSPYAFVDGSFNEETKVYGCGGFLVDERGERHIIQGSDDDPEMASMWNDAAEIFGATLAIKKALELELPKLTIYYDNLGIMNWATRNWKRNRKGTKAYSDFVNSIGDRITLVFIHVKAHSGIPGNEEADRMAKKAVGKR